MRSNVLKLGLLLLLLPAGAAAQQFAASQLIVPLPDGGFVSFKNETAWTDIRQAVGRQRLPEALGSQATADQNQTIHRVLRDNEGKFVFGYDLWVSPNPASKQFTIAVRPLDSQFENKMRAAEQPQASQTETVSTFPKSTEPQIINDGAEFSLDLLINQSKRVKIIDVVRVTFDRSRLWNDSPGARPRDFTLDAVELEMKDYSLLVNDNLIATGKSRSGCAGALLWIYIPNRGRFIFSLFPREGYAFQKAGVIAGNKMEFTVNGEHYRWLSSSPILREEGEWNLWVLSDAQYSPLFAVRPPPATEKSTLEKWDAVIGTVAQKATRIRNQRTGTLQNGTSTGSTETQVKESGRVMFGSADRIENLWPRSP